jgi:hypothetical protein
MIIDKFNYLIYILIMVQTNLAPLLVEPRIQTSQQCHVVLANLIRTVTRRHLNQHVTGTSVNAHLPEDV